MNIITKSAYALGISMITVISAQAQQYVKLRVSDQKAPCSNRNECILVKEGLGKWKPLSGNIEGFVYDENKSYVLLVERTITRTKKTSENNNGYKLVKIIQTRVANPNLNTMNTSKKSSSLSNNKYFFKEIFGNEVKLNDAFLEFNIAEGRLHGNNGCNLLNGQIEQKGNTLKFGRVISTMRGCIGEEVNNVSNAIGKLLHEETVTYSIEEGMLTLKNAKGEVVALLKEQSTSDLHKALDGMNWKLTSLNNVGMDYGNRFISFNLADKTFNGHSGCNGFSGQFTLDGKTIKTTTGMSTRMACADQEQNNIEADMMRTLFNKDLNFEIIGDVLTLMENSRTVAVFHKQ